MNLKHEKFEVICIDFWKLENLIRKTFPQLADYEIVAKMGWNNDCCYDYRSIMPISKMKSPEQVKPIQDLIDGKPFDINSYTIRPILDALCTKGLIEEGNYLISVSW